jgi:hypothetical protein
MYPQHNNKEEKINKNKMSEAKAYDSLPTYNSKSRVLDGSSL